MTLQLVDDLLHTFKFSFFDDLPDDITQHIAILYLTYKDQINFISCCKYLFYDYYAYYLYRYYSCRNCDSPLFHPKTVEFTKWSQVSDETKESTEMEDNNYNPNIEIEDGEAFILDLYDNDHDSILLQTSTDKARKLQTNIAILPDIKLCVDMPLCSGLRNHFNEFKHSLSFRSRILAMLFDTNFDENYKPKKLEFMVNSVVCNKCKLFLGFKIINVNNLNKEETLSNNFKNNVLNRLIICKNYIRLLSLDYNINCLINNKRIGIYCTGVRGKLYFEEKKNLKCCGNLLSFADEILSNEHCWSIDGKRENANYYNSMYMNSVYCCDSKMILCVQGEMMISKVICSKCDGEIGWRFELNQSELVKNKSIDADWNENQYGRYGLVNSSITYNPHKKTLIETDNDDDYFGYDDGNEIESSPKISDQDNPGLDVEL